MNIAIITTEVPYPDNSGGRKYTWERIKKLRQLGNNILLYSIEEEVISKKDKFELKKYCDEIKFYNRRNKIISILDFIKPFSAISRYSKNMKKTLKEDIISKKIDILIVDMPQLIYNIPQKCKIPIVLSQHNIEYKTFFNISKKSSNKIKKIIYFLEAVRFKKFEEKFYKTNTIKLFTFISKNDKQYFEKKYNLTNTLLVPMGIEYIKQNLDKSIIHNKMVFVGKMSYHPNEEAAKWFVNNIFPMIKSKCHNIKLYLVGKDPSKELIKLGNNSIIVTGTVDDVNKYIDEADIVVIPLLSGGGVKIKLIEALSRNKIVVTTSKGIEGTEFVNKKHVLVVDNEVEFANTCINVLNNIDDYKYLIDNSEEILTNIYSWESISKIYNNSLRELLINYKEL